MYLQLETRATIASINPIDRHIIISIADSPERAAQVATNANTVALLQIFFWDTNSETRNGDKIVSFTEQDAESILGFVFDNINGIDRIVAHCDAGQCRSPATLAALDKILHGTDDVWFRTKRPNTLVYRTLLNTAIDLGLWDPHG